MRISIPGSRIADPNAADSMRTSAQDAFYLRLMEEFRALPGVGDVAWKGARSRRTRTAPACPAPSSSRRVLARRAWPAESAIGKRFRYWERDNVVVGVAADVRDEERISSLSADPLSFLDSEQIAGEFHLSGLRKYLTLGNGPGSLTPDQRQAHSRTTASLHAKSAQCGGWVASLHRLGTVCRGWCEGGSYVRLDGRRVPIDNRPPEQRGRKGAVHAAANLGDGIARASVVAALAPGVRAASVNPIKALREE